MVFSHFLPRIEFAWQESAAWVGNTRCRSTRCEIRPQGMRVHDFKWEGWQAAVEATLLFVIQNERILLIEKKRGHGAGKVNGPGGKIDPGESALECALRETREELLISVEAATKKGELWFEMTDHPPLRCHVFVATAFRGTPTETEEAVPLWVRIAEIPYERMWEDDRHWLPMILAGKPVLGKFRFEGERLVSREIICQAFR